MGVLLLVASMGQPVTGQAVNQFDWVKTLPAEPIHQISDASRSYYVLLKGNILISFAADGRERWRQAWPTWPDISKISVDGAGNLILAGIFQGTATLGDSTFQLPVNQQNFFVASLSPARVLRWIRRLSLETSARTVADLRTDAAGQTYLLGITATSSLLATVGPTGKLVRQRYINVSGSTSPQPQALQLTSDASAYILYNAFGRSFNEAYLQKSDSARTNWQLTVSPLLGTSYAASGRSLGLDRQTNAYFLGDYGFLDRTTGQTLDAGQILVKSDPDGQPLWVKKGPYVRDSSRATGLVTDPAGTVIAYGQYDGTLIPNTFPAQYQPNDYVSLAQYATDGALRWKARFDSPTGNDKLRQIDRDAYGALLLTGSTTGPLPLGSLTVTGTASTPAWFLAKLQPARLLPDSTTRAVCAGGSMALPGRYSGYFETDLTILLSDSTGSFGRATVIGRVPITNPGNYFSGPVVPPSVVLPTGLPTGKNYRIRVVSSSPEYIGESIPVSVGTGPAKPVISQNNDELVSSAAQGNQWFTDRKEAISGATNQRLRPGQAGQYYVVATVGSCSSLPSDLFTYVITALEPAPAEPTLLTIYPNPATDRVLIDWSAVNASASARLLLYDLTGRLLRDIPRTGAVTELSLVGLSPGIYLVSAQADGQPVATRRLVISN